MPDDCSSFTTFDPTLRVGRGTWDSRAIRGSTGGARPLFLNLLRTKVWLVVQISARVSFFVAIADSSVTMAVGIC